MRIKSFSTSFLKYLSLFIGCFAALLPLWVVLIASLKTGEEFSTTNLFDAPQNWFNFSNYYVAITRGNMLTGFLNTSILLLISVTGTILIGTMAAYTLSRFKFRFKKLITFLFLLATLVPGVTTQIATFQVVNFFGLFNTRWAAIILFMGTDIISIYIFLQFLDSIPVELDEAAIIEGASYFTIYSKIILPLLNLP